jgi:hypothetical protein
MAMTDMPGRSDLLFLSRPRNFSSKRKNHLKLTPIKMKCYREVEIHVRKIIPETEVQKIKGTSRGKT